MEGWIKLYRKVRENPVFNDVHLFRLWIICLTEATHKERDQIVGKQVAHLMPGEFVTGRFDLHEMFNKGLKKKEQKPPTTIWRWLEVLETYEFLVINSNNKYSVVSILKWQEYQQTDQQNGQQMVNKWSTDGQQVVTNKNVKNEEKVKHIADSDECGEWFEQFWNLYPKKQGKTVAEKKFKSYYKNGLIDFEKVMKGTSAYIEYVKKERARGFDRQYMDGSTYVNQQRWKDDYKVVEVVGKRQPDIATLTEAEGDLFDRAYRDQIELNKKNVRTERRPHGNTSDTPA